MYQTCGFIKIKSQHTDNQYKIKNNFNNKGDQLVVFVIFNALNSLLWKKTLLRVSNVWVVKKPAHFVVII